MTNVVLRLVLYNRELQDMELGPRGANFALGVSHRALQYPEMCPLELHPGLM